MELHRSHSRVDMFGNLLLDYQESPTMEFKELTNQDAKVSMVQELQKLLDTAPEEQKHERQKEFDEFLQLFGKFVSEPGPSINWDQIEKLPPDSIRSYTTLPRVSHMEEIRSMLDQLVVIKLNGALATSIGCSGPTCTIPVRNNLTSLDMTVQQIEHLNNTYGTNVPLVLMNSFLTDEDTSKIVRKYSGFKIKIKTFTQSCYPRINKESLMPLARTCCPDDNTDAWYPPGHGDFYEAFARSGLLDQFVSEGKKFCFISNTDNLGATVDLNILKMCLSGQEEFIMEVTEKTRADVKGGTLIHYKGKLRLLEVAQVPKDQLEDFMSVKKFKVFNTNNLWISMAGIQRVVKKGVSLKGTVIIIANHGDRIDIPAGSILENKIVSGNLRIMDH